MPTGGGESVIGDQGRFDAAMDRAAHDTREQRHDEQPELLIVNRKHFLGMVEAILKGRVYSITDYPDADTGQPMKVITADDIPHIISEIQRRANSPHNLEGVAAAREAALLAEKAHEIQQLRTRLGFMEGQYEAARDAADRIDKALELHRVDRGEQADPDGRCFECGEIAPCPTRAALEPAPGDEADTTTEAQR